jgi:hypothetical protein
MHRCVRRHDNMSWDSSGCYFSNMELRRKLFQTVCVNRLPSPIGDFICFDFSLHLRGHESLDCLSQAERKVLGIGKTRLKSPLFAFSRRRRVNKLTEVACRHHRLISVFDILTYLLPDDDLWYFILYR